MYGNALLVMPVHILVLYNCKVLYTCGIWYLIFYAVLVHLNTELNCPQVRAVATGTDAVHR